MDRPTEIASGREPSGKKGAGRPRALTGEIDQQFRRDHHAFVVEQAKRLRVGPATIYRQLIRILDEKKERSAARKEQQT